MLANPPDDAVSPELALVDATIRDRLIEEDEGPSEDRVEEPIRGADGSEANPPTKRRRGRVVVGAAVLAAVVAVVAAGIRLQASGGGASRAETSTTTTTPTAVSPAASRSTGRNFAWAPVRGASEYDVEIRRNSGVVYTATTSAPHVTVPAQWVRAGRKLELSPGTYSWYVWPVLTDGSRRRRGAAVVATTFVVR